ncbi:MAG: hypothetical protein L6Q92_01935 [Phycisphaerae bacterium]|nr:hypothetical protein [Phycisphaerae bacterium]
MVVLMAEQPFQLIVPEGGAKRCETVAQGRQRDFRIRLPGLCTDGVHAGVGQHPMNPAADVQVMHDAPVAQHRVIAQSQVAFQFLEQHLDPPTPLIDRYDRALAASHAESGGAATT